MNPFPKIPIFYLPVLSEPVVEVELPVLVVPLAVEVAGDEAAEPVPLTLGVTELAVPEDVVPVEPCLKILATMLL